MYCEKDGYNFYIVEILNTHADTSFDTGVYDHAGILSFPFGGVDGSEDIEVKLYFDNPKIYVYELGENVGELKTEEGLKEHLIGLLKTTDFFEDVDNRREMIDDSMVEVLFDKLTSNYAELKGRLSCTT